MCSKHCFIALAVFQHLVLLLCLLRWPSCDANTIKSVLQCLLHMPQIEFALDTAESIAKVRNLGITWGMCIKHIVTLWGMFLQHFSEQ